MNSDHTFVITAFGESCYLEECVRSLINQTLQSNIVISTSTPCQNVYDLAKKYSIPMHVHNNGGSIAKDWNEAIKVANTTFVTIAHQDDIYEREYLQECSKSFGKTGPIILFSNYDEINENSDTKQRNRNLIIKDIMLYPLKYASKSRWVRKRILSFGNPICCPSITYNKALLKSFEFSNDFLVAIDWEALYRIAAIRGSWKYINKRLMSHRIHEESETTRTIGNNIRTKEEIKMFKKFWPEPIAEFLSKVYRNAQNGNMNENKNLKGDS